MNQVSDRQAGAKKRTSGLFEQTPASARSISGLAGAEVHPTDAGAIASLMSLLPSLRIFIGLACAALVIAGLYLGQELLVPLALAILLSFLLDPLVSRLKRWGIPRAVGALIVVVIALAALFGAGTYLGSQLRSVSEDLPTYTTTIKGKLSKMRSYLQGPSMWDGAMSTFNVVGAEIAKRTAETAAKNGESVAPVQKVEVVNSTGESSLQVLNWLGRLSAPVVTTGIVTLFVILILISREDLRDRLLRLLGGNIHLATDALDEASERIGRYLRMQLLVNLSYGVPMAIGLWFIGVPGAILWGSFAAIMRFIPYVGPLLCAVFPLTLAFAIDPGWNMLLWTLGLILVLELISNNVIEPWLYGSSTGLSTLSIILAATFWTSIWGAIGLILSTPLTVCLLVMGRYVPALRFMEVLLGSSPVLGTPERLYQRLVAGNVDEAVAIADEDVEERLPDKATPAQTRDALTGFYDNAAIPALRLASELYTDVATPQHRLRLVNGMNEILDDLTEEYPSIAALHAGSTVLCIGARWEVDVLAAEMIEHALGLSGFNASSSARTLASGLPEANTPAILEAGTLCLSIFQSSTPTQIRIWCRRFKRRWPHLKIVLALWNASPDVLRASEEEQLGADAVATSLRELVLRMEAMQDRHLVIEPTSEISAQEIKRLEHLAASGALDSARFEEYGRFLQRVADIFDVRYALISWVDKDWVYTPGSLALKGVSVTADRFRNGVARRESICSTVIERDAPLLIEDIERDPRFASLPAVDALDLRFYAGVPLRDADDFPLGVLSLLDTEPRTLDEEEMMMLAKLGEELMSSLHEPVMRTSGNEVSALPTQ
jgi:predicted PurR-regulated permease PerM